MSSVRINLVPPDDEPWPLTPGGMYCPVCFSKIPANKKLEHTGWHRHVSDLFQALGVYKVVEYNE